MMLTDKKVETLLSNKELRRSDIKYLIKYCKELITSRKKIKWKIVQIGLRVCDKTEHGGHTSSIDYTFAQFARDIGIAEKTLWRWKKEYVVLYSKVPEKSLKDLKRKEIEKIIGKVKADTPTSKVKQIIEEQRSKSPEERISTEYLYKFSNINFFYSKKVSLDLLPKDHIDKVYKLAKEIVEAIEEYKKKGDTKKKKRQAKRDKALELLH